MTWAVSEVEGSLVCPGNRQRAKAAMERGVAVWTGWSEGPHEVGSLCLGPLPSTSWHWDSEEALHRAVTGPDWHSSETDLLQCGEWMRRWAGINLRAPPRRALLSVWLRENLDKGAVVTVRKKWTTICKVQLDPVIDGTVGGAEQGLG